MFLSLSLCAFLCIRVYWCVTAGEEKDVKELQAMILGSAGQQLFSKPLKASQMLTYMRSIPMDIVLLTNAKQTKGNIIGCVFIGNRAQPLMTTLTMMITLMLKLMTGVDDRPSTDYVDVETDDNDNAECRC